MQAGVSTSTWSQISEAFRWEPILRTGLEVCTSISRTFSVHHKCSDGKLGGGQGFGRDMEGARPVGWKRVVARSEIRRSTDSRTSDQITEFDAATTTYLCLAWTRLIYETKTRFQMRTFGLLVKVEFPLVSLTLEKADILWLIIKEAETGFRNCT